MIFGLYWKRFSEHDFFDASRMLVSAEVFIYAVNLGQFIPLKDMIYTECCL